MGTQNEVEFSGAITGRNNVTMNIMFDFWSNSSENFT